MFSIDLETYSAEDIKHGIYKYAKNCELLLFGYCEVGEEVYLIDLTRNEKIPQVVINIVKNDRIKKYAWNATFERIVLSNYLNTPLSAAGWDCTQVRGSYKGLNLKLGVTAKALGTNEKTDNKLISFFCKPNSKGDRHLPVDYPEKWEEFREYCKNDVKTEYEIRQLLKDIPIESSLYTLDGIINDRGVRVNLDLVDNCIRFITEESAEILEALKELTGLDNPNSIAQLKNWLLIKNIVVDSLNKEKVTELLNTDIDPEVRRMLEMRQMLGRSSTKKYKAIKDAHINGRVHGLLQFCGATRTHRWAGRIVQPQNLYRNKEPLLKEARDMAIKGVDPRLIFDDDIIAQLIRTCFEGPFSIADFSAIEARILAWLAGEKWLMDVFAGDGKVYEAQAAKMYNVTLAKVTKELRSKGKIATLALGYGGGEGALAAMGYKGTYEELEDIKIKYRNANPRIRNLWYEIEDAVKECVKTGEMIKISYITITRDPKWLYIQMPSGRKISYFNPRIVGDCIIYTGTALSVWQEAINTFGGKIVENIVQSIARDCLAIVLKRLQHLPIVMHIHDEIVVEGDHLQEMITEMERIISWAPGLILRSAGFISDFYRKD